ncbi:hypothetical protein ACFXKG_30635 [Streptomyces sp. NPDC059255]|uniref:hypothetical protein n=1 Tax=Streptomyces sp. NPDC059255 TaxID=3346793 RepID=UPI003688EF48
MTRRVALAAPHGHHLVEHGTLGRLQLGGAEEFSDLAASRAAARAWRARSTPLSSDSVVMRSPSR